MYGNNYIIQEWYNRNKCGEEKKNVTCILRYSLELNQDGRTKNKKEQMEKTVKFIELE